jgi:NitT/TauT family transport system substrate-binding protein
MKKGVILFFASVILLFYGEKEEREELNYRLKRLYNVSTVGDLYAEAHGHFGCNGLKVYVKYGGTDRDALKELELGHAQFGVASTDQVLRAAVKGAPIIVLAQLFQVNPLHWTYRPEKALFAKPQDLKDKTTALTLGGSGSDESILRALHARLSITEDQVQLFSVRCDYTPFDEGKVAFWPLCCRARRKRWTRKTRTRA